MNDQEVSFSAASNVTPVRPVRLTDLPALVAGARGAFTLDRGAGEGAAFRPLDFAALVQAATPAAEPGPDPVSDPFAAEPPVAAVPDPAPADAAPAPEPGYAEGHAEGHSAGWAEGHEAGRQAGLAEARAQLGAAVDLLAAAHARLTTPGVAETESLGRAIQAAVRDLAAERAGQAIDAAPRPFVARIERMAQRIAQGAAEVELRLNPDDLATLEPHLARSPQLAAARVYPAPELARGDVDLRVPGVHVADLIHGGEDAPQSAPRPDEAAA